MVVGEGRIVVEAVSVVLVMAGEAAVTPVAEVARTVEVLPLTAIAKFFLKSESPSGSSRRASYFGFLFLPQRASFHIAIALRATLLPTAC
jgi:hypothetical protein